MKSKNIIKTFYILFVIYLYLLYLISNFSIINFVLSVIVLGFLYSSFSLGYISPAKLKIKFKKDYILIKEFNKKNKLLLFAILLFSSFLYVNYYTGKLPFQVIKSYINNISVYNEYQQYFMFNNLGKFTLKKIPYILIGALIKLIAFRSLLEMGLTSNNLKIKDIISNAVLVIPYIYIGFGRGTSFEFFEVLILFIYIIFRKIKKVKIKTIAKIILILALGIGLFMTLVNARNYSYNYSILSDGIYYDNSKFSSMQFPNLSKVIYRLYGYFGFGFYYISNFLEYIVFKEKLGIGKLFLPKFSEVFYNVPISLLMDQFVDVGVRWRPDFVSFLDNYGLIIFFFKIFVLGWISSSLEENNFNVKIELLNFFIVLQMFSMPIGNFVYTSSSTKLILMFLLLSLIKDQIFVI